MIKDEYKYLLEVSTLKSLVLIDLGTPVVTVVTPRAVYYSKHSLSSYFV